MRGDKLDLESVFKDNNPGFEIALEETIQYNDHLLARQSMHQDLKESIASRPEKGKTKQEAEDAVASKSFRKASKKIFDAIAQVPSALGAAKKVWRESRDSGKTRLESDKAACKVGQKIINKVPKADSSKNVMASQTFKEKIQAMKENTTPNHTNKENKAPPKKNKGNDDNTRYSPQHKL
jgi:hypothetical protein